MAHSHKHHDHTHDQPAREHAEHDHSTHNHDDHDHDDHDHDSHAGHSHGHHGHSHAPQKFTTAFAIATGVNFLFVIIEAIYAISANSMSLLADAGHNLGDVLGLAMSGGALWLLSKASTAKYSYGFKRTTILAALSNAVILVVATALIIIESVKKLLSPAPVGELTIMVVAAIGILVNGGTALLFMRGHDDLNVKGAFLHLAFDALISLGVVIVGALVLWTHWLWLDPVVGIAIAIAILFGTWGLLRQSLDLILDAVPHNIKQDKVLAYLQNLPMVKQVHHLHIWGLSTQEVALTAHLVVPEANFTDADLRTIETHLAEKFNIKHATIQVERHTHENEHCETC